MTLRNGKRTCIHVLPINHRIIKLGDNCIDKLSLQLTEGLDKVNHIWLFKK